MRIFIAYLLLWSAGVMTIRAAKPPSLIQIFDEGYGVVYAEVIQQVRERSRQPNNVDKHRVSFKVKQVVAHPKGAPEFPLQPDSFCTVWMTVGPGAMLVQREDAKPVLAKGTKYFLMVRYEPSKAVYVHAPYAGLLEPVPRDNPGAVQYMRILATLARLPEAQRADRCNRLLLDNRVGEPLRRQVLAEAVRLKDPKFAATLQQYWDIQQVDMSDAFAIELDLQTRNLIGDSFVQSEGRREYWLKRFFRPIERGDANEVRLRNNVLLPVMVELGQIHPERVGNLMLVGINDSQWSTAFRVTNLRGMLNLYRTVETVPEDWQGSLPHAVTQLENELEGAERGFLKQVMGWAASPPNDREKRSYP